MADPVQMSPGQVVGVTKLVRNLSYYLDRVREQPFYIMRNNQIEAVLLTVDEYRRLMQEGGKKSGTGLGKTIL